MGLRFGTFGKLFEALAAPCFHLPTIAAPLFPNFSSLFHTKSFFWEKNDLTYPNLVGYFLGNFCHSDSFSKRSLRFVPFFFFNALLNLGC